MSDSDQNQAGLIDCHGSTKALRLLQTLNKTPAGKVLYQQIERILRDADLTSDKIIRGYTALALTMIEAYRSKLPKDSLLYLELKLIQKRLLPPISISELVSLQNYLKNASNLINELSDQDNDVIKDALNPLMGAQNSNEPLSDFLVSTENQEEESTSQGNLSLHNKLESQRQELENVYEKMLKQLKQTSSSHQAFEQQLTTTQHELENITDPDDLAFVRKQILDSISAFKSQQDKFATVLNNTTQLLKETKQHSQKLVSELNQVRVLSLTDDLTHLPNRRAFIRRLEDEINRSQRESSPLILGLMDLDFFKDINDKYGHNVGDAILQVYANDILSVFRHYDMVARYGGEEFGVILPNTDYEGAIKAFKKVQKRAIGNFYRLENTRIALPTFSAGLAMHKPGESSSVLIERADELLYKAKHGGRNRIEIDNEFITDSAQILQPNFEN